MDPGEAGRELPLRHEGQAARVVEHRRRIVGLGGEGAGHAHGFGALLEDAESGRVDRSRGQSDEGNEHQGPPHETASPLHGFPPVSYEKG
jgi:hypothetical protein